MSHLIYSISSRLSCSLWFWWLVWCWASFSLCALSLRMSSVFPFRFRLFVAQRGATAPSLWGWGQGVWLVRNSRSLCTTLVFATFTLRLITHHRIARQSVRFKLLSWGDEVEGSNSLHQGGTFLFNYRTSPHTTAGHSPAELMFGWRLRMRLELLKLDLRGQVCTQQERQKTGYDAHSKHQASSMPPAQPTAPAQLCHFSSQGHSPNCYGITISHWLRGRGGSVVTC